MKTWKLEPGEDIGIVAVADSLGFAQHDDGYEVLCAHCDQPMLKGYKPSDAFVIEVITCQHCGGLNRFDGRPPEG